MEFPVIPTEIKNKLCAELKAEIALPQKKKGEPGFKKVHSCQTHPENNFTVGDNGIVTRIEVGTEVYGVDFNRKPTPPGRPGSELKWFQINARGDVTPPVN